MRQFRHTVRMLMATLILPSVTMFAQQSVAADRAPTARDTKAASVVLSRLVDLQAKDLPLNQAIDLLAVRSGVPILYRYDQVTRYKTPVNLHLTRVPLQYAFQRLLAGTTLMVVPVEDGRLAIVEALGNDTRLKQGAIVGSVTDANTKRPLHGVTILIDDASKGIQTGDDGMYRLPNVAPGTHRVTARLIGYLRQTQTVILTDGQSVALNFSLESRATALDQVVVTGVVTPTELKAVPNAMTVITAEQIEQRGITKIDQLFRGDVPGLFAQNQGSNAFLDEVTMFSRGTTALSSSSAGTDRGTNPIKTYVDGVELANPKYLSQIDPKSIERIEILTGPQASTIYGSNAINGVMQIFTKRGTTNMPQLTLNLLSGWVENNFSSAHTPQHDYSTQLNGVDGRISYNAGGSWNYMGPWTPAKQTARVSSFGGARFELPTTLGRVTADVTLRRTLTQNRQRGNNQQTYTGYRETGWYSYSIFGSSGLSQPTTYTVAGQMLGLVVGYAPTRWWSHEFGVGRDASDAEIRRTAFGYLARTDTTLLFQQDHTDRRSLRYTNTSRVAVTSLAQATITVGADNWQTLTSWLYVEPQTLTGPLAGPIGVSRQPEHNTGGFLQTQFGVNDRLFFTYGFRAEWNPNYGAEAQPNYAPRYGIAYTQELGAVTAKLRASYGRSTRPPAPNRKVAVMAATLASYAVPDYGNYEYYLANPELTPEYQSGKEWGGELYLGTRGSLVITRYNQTVSGLIASFTADSVRSLAPNPASGDSPPDANGYRYQYQYQFLNVGNIRNQGWELQGSMNAGPFTTRGTYSWTKSRSIGVNSKYRTFFTARYYPQYQPGATFQFLPEHTWAAGMTYARAQTTIGLDVTGTGRAMNFQDDFYFRNLRSNIRLSQNVLNMSFGTGYVSFNRTYALADLVTSHQFSSRMEGVLQIQNLMNRYTNDYSADYATIGRQTKAGLRIRLQ